MKFISSSIASAIDIYEKYMNRRRLIVIASSLESSRLAVIFDCNAHYIMIRHVLLSDLTCSSVALIALKAAIAGPPLGWSRGRKTRKQSDVLFDNCSKEIIYKTEN
jgi:hypothetical protein